MRIGRKQPTHGSSTLQSDSGKMRPPERQRGRWQRISPAKVWLRTTSWRSNRAQRWDAGASCEFESISNRNYPARNYPALGSLSCVAYSGSEWLCRHFGRRRFRLFEESSISPSPSTSPLTLSPAPVDDYLPVWRLPRHNRLKGSPCQSFF